MKIQPYHFVVSAAWLFGLCVTLAGAQGPAKPVPVLVAEVRKDNFVDRVEALGTLRANESVTLTASVTETVRAIHFDDGQRVEADHLLVEMTSAEEHAQLEEARAEFREAQLQFDRLKSLVERGAVTPANLDEQKRKLETARARLDAIESRLQDRIIKAPFAGVVGLRNISVGALVTPGAVVATLDDDSVMKLDFSVPSRFLPTLRAGLSIVAFARALSEEKPFSGEVSSIDSRVDEVTRSIVVRARISNPERILKPGLLMTVELLKDPREALLIPEEAVTSLGKDQFVFVAVQQGSSTIAEKRTIHTGARQPGEVEVIEGLQVGEKVVVHGTMQARPGAELSVLAIVQPGQSIQELLARGARTAELDGK